MDLVDRSLKNEQSHSRAELKAGKLLAFAEATLPEDRSARLDFLRQLDSENILAFVERLNGVVRDTPIPERRFDGEDVAVGTASDTTFVPPAFEDRKAILTSALDAAKSMEDPEKAAALIYYIVPFVHLALDGNGRSARALYWMIRDAAGTPPGFPLEEALNSGGRSKFDKLLKPQEDLVSQTERLILFQLEPQEVFANARRAVAILNASDVIGLAGPNLSEANSQQLAKIVWSSHLGVAALIQRAVNTPGHNISPRALEPNEHFDNPGVGIDGQALWPHLDDDAAKEIIASFNAMRRNQAEIIVDIFANSQHPGCRRLADWAMNRGEFAN